MIEENYLYRAKPNVVVRRPQGVKPLAVRRPEGVNFGNFRKGFKILAVVSSLDLFAYFLCQNNPPMRIADSTERHKK